MRKVTKLLLTTAIFFSLFFFNHRAFAQNKCNCWINSKTGQVVRSYPFHSEESGDSNHAYRPETGDNFHRDQDCNWVNSKTGQVVRSYPFHSEESGGDPNHAYRPETGDNFHRVSPCPLQHLLKKDTAAKTAYKDFPHKDIFVGFSLIREDNGSNGFNTYGGELAYTRNLSGRGGITGDVGINFGSYGMVDYTKINILAGGTYYPIKTAVPASDFSFSVHALAGLSNIKSSYGSSSFSKSYFTMDLGVGFNYYFGDKTGVGLRIGYMPTFSKGNTSNNIRLGLGLDFR